MGIVLKTKIGVHGQIVIPKVFREHLGLQEGSGLIMEAMENEIVIKPLNYDVAKKWRKIAREEGFDFKKEKVVYGDKLYEEVF